MTSEQISAIRYRPIGIIHTPFKRLEDAPAQGCFAPDCNGHIELFPQFIEGLHDIVGFSHLILIYHFHRSKGHELLTKPLLDRRKHGVFATRYFRRPNPIGLSIVSLHNVQDNVLEIGWVDMLDGTPLLDIKPYVGLFDARDSVVDGWLATASEIDKNGRRRRGTITDKP